MQSRTKSNYLIARIREEADAKERVGKAPIARKARYVANSIENCFGIDIALDNINEEWLDEYLHFLQHGGKTDNTISNYFRIILSSFRSAVRNGAVLDLTILDKYFTGNAKSTREILSIDDVKRIINSDFNDAVFKRTRDVFSLCFFGGGLRVEDLLSFNQTTQRRLNATAEAKNIMRQYVRSGLLTFLGKDFRETYIHNLSGMAYKLNIRVSLNDDSAAEGWGIVAKRSGISHDVISKVIGRHIDNLNYANDVEIGAEEIEKALACVAERVGVTTRHWYAIRCCEDNSEDTMAKIKKLPSLKSAEIKHFFIDDAAKENRKAMSRKNYMKSILFVNCVDADIRYIRRSLAPSVYVFDYACDHEKHPAIISDREMKNFMYLAGLSSASMIYYFPDEVEKIPSFEEYEDVVITQGVFAGVKAKVLKKSKEKLNVVVRFEQANICYTVDIPCHLLESTVVTE
jgi:transcription antitermination factor NusG